MRNIDTSSWRDFSLMELFGLPIRGSRLVKESRVQGSVPLVTAGCNNQGVAEYIQNPEQETFDSGFTIDMFGNCFYRDYEFKADDNILIFDSADIPIDAKLFIVASVNKVTNNMFSYGRQYRLKSYKETMIKLPVTKTEEIDWDFMQERIKELEQERIKELEQERIKELEQYLIATGLNDYELTAEDKIMLSCKPNFKSFKLASTYVKRGKLIEVDETGLFDIVPTKKKINANKITFDGRFPYVARGESKNGIQGYIDFDEQYLNSKNTISFGQDTASMKYQPNDYFTGDKIQVFKLNDSYGILTENIALYLISSMKKSFANFDWGQQSFALDAIAEIPVELPVDNYGNADFKFMSEYIQAIKKLTIKDVVDWKDREIEATKQIVG